MNNTRTYTLLVWENVPEKCDMYTIPNDEAEKFRQYLTLAHNKLLNYDDNNDGLSFLNVALSDQSVEECEGWTECNIAQYAGIWKKYKVEPTSPLKDVVITHVYRSGFAM
jgi:hypothetical protein